MGYGQDFEGTYAFRSSHHMEAGLDAMASQIEREESGSFVTPGDFERATSRRLNLKLEVYGPASMHFSTTTVLLQLARHASSGYIRVDFEGDPPEYLRAYGPQDELPPRHRGYDLYHAAVAGELKGVNAALKHGADPDFELSAGQRPLLQAVRGDHVEIVRALLGAGAEPLAWEHASSTMHMATSAAMVDALLEAGLSIDICKPDHESATPLAEACYRGHREVAMHLIALGAEVTSPANVLVQSARQGWVDVLAYVRHRCEVLPHEALDSALDVARRTGQEQAAQWCLDHGAQAK